MATAADPLLDIQGLSLDFASPAGPVHALRDIDVTVPRGRIVGVVGESGCGKSTLASTIIRLLAANASIVSGHILFEGEDLATASERRMRQLRGSRMSMIFQDPMTALNPVRSIGDQMIEIQHRMGGSKADKRRRARDMLATVGIPDPDNRLTAYPHQFSGGMRQRICIAMALLVEPSLILADEPTTALDATLEVQIVNLLKRLQADTGCSILFVSHHLGTVTELCDDVVVMYAGEVVEAGDVREIFHNPSHPYTQALLRCDPGRIREPTRQLPTIPGEIPDLSDLPPGCIFQNRCPRAHARCAREAPGRHRVSEGHTASCHLLAETEEVPA
ncbi:peptide/nickel transport system ATP-binding protein/peptide/nickel transport system ATP-binding protein [Limimonas halophila]|uniref:Peptide/nickel transport system ATP-binding protein/peptide/nickel transport system ATP-binding protein n=1 Tax=Limimonas halophila TaxID=1082479 RepID=A0A1G7T0G7_9PROT|nr:ABC transporter ATP-binding protein [Limimonas halophila]SDG28149.1 peptide/nickel transport system ATP-binding protein/peptide/nickel transport system ATP-binding protein [Limimonas halophila]